MEGLSTLLIVFGFGTGVGMLVSGVVALLVCIFINTKKSTQQEDDEEGTFVIPYSALTGGRGGGGRQLQVSCVWCCITR